MAAETIVTKKLGPGDLQLARAMIELLAEVFEEESEALSDGYIERLLGRGDFLAVAALSGPAVVGGVTAHVLPMTRSESSELFIYDVAVATQHQRKGVGRRLIAALRAAAAERGIEVAFVPADNEDTHALDFYRALGGAPSPVTLFTFSEK